MNMSFVLRLPGKIHLCRCSSNACHSFWKCYKTLTFCSLLKVHNPLHLPRKTTSERPKVFRTGQFSTRLTSKCASRHNSVHFFDIATSKSAPNLMCLCILASKCASPHNAVHFFIISTSKRGPNLVRFVHFDFEMCFAPQRRAIFHLSSGQLAPHPPL